MNCNGTVEVTGRQGRSLTLMTNNLSNDANDFSLKLLRFACDCHNRILPVMFSPSVAGAATRLIL